MARTAVATTESATRLLQIHDRYRKRAEDAQRQRREQNRTNWELFHLRQDWTNKQPWQSRVFLPDFPVAIQQIVATLRRGLTDADDWLLAEPVGLGRPLLDQDAAKALLVFHLERLAEPGNRPESARSIAGVLNDVLLHALLEGLLTVKVFAVERSFRRYRLERQQARDNGEGVTVLYEHAGKQLAAIDDATTRLAIDVLPFEAYLPDPSSAKLYDIHRVERTLGELAANPEYDPEVVRTLYQKAWEAGEEQDRGAREAHPTSASTPDPYLVVVDECWGDAVDERTGEVLERNVFWTVCAGQLLRPPTPNPWWHGRRPIVSVPLFRVRGAQTHPALADRAADVVRARNELESLMLDGAFGEVWGTRQCRTDLLEDDSDVQDGVPQGYTAVLRPNVPEGLKFLERVDTAQIPQLALEMRRDLDASFQQALAVPDTKLGAMPARQVKATEIVEASQASGNFFESLAAVIEDEFLEPVFELAWQTLLQYADDFREPELVAILGPELALQLQELDTAARFTLLRDVTFRVRGLRGVAAKQRTFQKLSTILDRIATAPALAELFDKTMSIGLVFEDLLRAAGLDPARYRRPPEEVEDPDNTAEAPADARLDPALLAGAPGAGTPRAPMSPAGEQAEAEAAFAPVTPAGVPEGAMQPPPPVGVGGGA